MTGDQAVPLPPDAVDAAAEAAEKYAVNWPADAIVAVASAVHLEPDASWVSDEACAAAALEGLDAWLGRFALADDIPKAAFTAARRAFPVAAPHALKAALAAAADVLAATERERIRQLADEHNALYENGTEPCPCLGDCGGYTPVFAPFADLLDGTP